MFCNGIPEFSMRFFSLGKGYISRGILWLAATLPCFIGKNQDRFFYFWEVGEVGGVSIFCLWAVGIVRIDCGWVVEGYKTQGTFL